MLRRVHTKTLSAGMMSLDPGSVRHVRDVLRLTAGDDLELFDDAGRTAAGRIVSAGAAGVDVSVATVVEPVIFGSTLTVAAAIPKGDRAEWMIEKLCEIGVDRFVPLETTRGVVVPGGRNKIDRWERIAIEAAKQSRRTGLMRIDPVISVADFLKTATGGLILSTEAGSRPIATVIGVLVSLLMIGPEGGWTPGELAAASAVGIIPVGLTATVLRVETAAVVAAGVVMCGRRVAVE